MPGMTVTDPNWTRSLYTLYEGKEFTGVALGGVTAGTTTLTTYLAQAGTSGGTIYPGHVARLTSAGFVKADSTVSSGDYFGLFFTEVSATVDEVVTPQIDPVVMVEGTHRILAAALQSTAGAVNTYVTDGTAANEELIAGTGAYVGRLVPRADDTTSHTVAKLLASASDGSYIEVELLKPSVTVQ